MKAEAVHPDQIIDRQGKKFCLFKGLLDAAHRSGLRSVSTKLEQAPDEANGRLAITSAIVTFVFTAAAPQSTNATSRYKIVAVQ